MEQVLVEADFSPPPVGDGSEGIGGAGEGRADDDVDGTEGVEEDEGGECERSEDGHATVEEEHGYLFQQHIHAADTVTYYFTA